MVVQAVAKRKATVNIDDSPTKRAQTLEESQALVEWLGKYSGQSNSTFENDSTFGYNSVSGNNKVSGNTVQSA